MSQKKNEKTYSWLKNIASQYQSLTDWYVRDKESYKRAVENGVVNKIAKELGWVGFSPHAPK